MNTPDVIRDMIDEAIEALTVWVSTITYNREAPAALTALIKALEALKP